MADVILVLNAGSSSIKFRAFDDAGRRARTRRARAGRKGCTRRPRFARSTAPASTSASRRGTKGAAIWIIARRDCAHRRLSARAIAKAYELIAVGHRVVHGGAALHAAGARHARSARRSSTKLTPLAPLHQPHNLKPIRIIAEASSGRAAGRVLRHGVSSRAAGSGAGVRAAGVDHRRAACGATAFTACRTSTSRACCPNSRPSAATGRTVVAHLGNGASMCAMVGGQERREHDGLHGRRRPADGHALRQPRSRRGPLSDGQNWAWTRARSRT